MTTLYKLTDKDGRTRGDTKWGEGATHTTDGQGDLCGPGWLHAYTDPLFHVTSVHSMLLMTSSSLTVNGPGSSQHGTPGRGKDRGPAGRSPAGSTCAPGPLPH
jgi:hypothetical protein